MAYKSFLELDVWKLGRQFKLSIYAILSRFPDHERFELTSQLRRAVRSIPANVAEGHGRRTLKEQSSFCIIARGSHSETLNHLIDAYDCGYISKEELCALKEQLDVLGKTLNAYITFLQSRISIKTKTSLPDTVEEATAEYKFLPESRPPHERFLSVLNNEHDPINQSASQPAN